MSRVGRNEVETHHFQYLVFSRVGRNEVETHHFQYLVFSRVGRNEVETHHFQRHGGFRYRSTHPTFHPTFSYF